MSNTTLQWVKASDKLPEATQGAVPIVTKWNKPNHEIFKVTTVNQFLDTVKNLDDSSIVEYLSEAPLPSPVQGMSAEKWFDKNFTANNNNPSLSKEKFLEYASQYRTEQHLHSINEIKQIPLTSYTVLWIPVPEGARNIRLSYTKTHILHSSGAIELPSGSWSIIGVDPLTEEQIGMVVEKTDNPFWYGQNLPYIDYATDDNCFATIPESFTSFLTAHKIEGRGVWLKGGV